MDGSGYHLCCRYRLRGFRQQRKWYKSQNAGLTWTQDKKVALPGEFDTATAARFAFCRDKQHYYWIIRNGYVWRGRFNIDGWSKED